MDIYRQIIIDHYQHPHNFGVLKKPTVTHQEENSFCGDKISMDLIISNDKIKEISFSGTGCAISMASASFLTDMVLDKTIKDARNISKEDLIKKLNVELSVTRLKCAWLSWEVFQKALFKIDGKI